MSGAITMSRGLRKFAIDKIAGDFSASSPMSAIDADCHGSLANASGCDTEWLHAPSVPTTFFAASVRSIALMIFLPLSASILRAFSTLVPSSRTTSGTLMPTLS
jgi:hypothetical protein